MRARRCLWLLCLLCGSITPTLLAQPAPFVAQLRQAAQASHTAARQWAARHHLPMHIRQPDGTRIELMGYTGNRPYYLRPHNRTAARTTRTHTLHPIHNPALALTGAGLAIGLWDAGHPLENHQEFGSRIVRGDRALFEDHATHVAGTLAAAGADPDAQGMAFEADLRVFNWRDDTAEMAQDALRNNLLISNHSYGPLAGWEFGDVEGQGAQWYWMGNLNQGEEAAFGRYALEAEQWDFLMLQSPYLLPVVSAGNHRDDAGPPTNGTYRARDPLSNAWTTYTRTPGQPGPAPDGGLQGYDTLAGQAVAKNPLTVGSIGDLAGPNDAPSAFSAFGPTDDGRVKPDVLANGEGLLSPLAASTTAYGIWSGTSMAAPNVAGSLLLLQQLHHRLTDQFMRAATLKALALHTATDLGTPGPDYQSGWGLLNAQAAAAQVADQFRNAFALKEGLLHDQETQTFEVLLEQPGPVRVTLCWTDPHGNPTPDVVNQRTPSLINDLDVRLIAHETGTVYRPFVLNPEAPTQQALPGDNTRDPIEQIFLPEAEAGAYTIIVSHKGALQKLDAQPFSLLTTGLVDEIRLVTLADFSASVSADGVTLKWTTDREFRNGDFVLERQPTDQPAVELARIPATGPGNVPVSYSYTNPNPVPGRHTYRLRFVPSDAAATVAATLDFTVPAARIERLTADATLERVRLAWDVPFAFSAGVLDITRSRLLLGGTLEAPVQVGRLDLAGPNRAGTAYGFEDPFVPSGTYQYHIRLDTTEVAALQVTVPVPAGLALVSNFPNPFSARTELILDIPASTVTTVAVYDVLGRPVWTGVQAARLGAGRYRFTLEAASWPPGLYVIRVETTEGLRTRPMIRIE